jgi:two-component system, OmpR family, phosphate regulon sensor histidine kinase PhoR
MGKVSRKIWWIATPALLAALLFQLYWLRQTYQSQHDAFLAIATEAFHNSYDNSIIITAKLKAGDRSTEKSRYSIQTTIDIEDDEIEDLLAGTKNIIHKEDTAQTGPSARIQKNIRVDSTSIIKDSSALAHFVSNIFSSFTDVVPDADTLRAYYRAELDKKNIPLPFKLLLSRKEVDSASNPPDLLIHPGVKSQGRTAGAMFTGLTAYLLEKMSGAIILSVFITFLIIGCIWILWRIIIRQEKLESMKREFISHVTHELKTPVSILQATNEVLLSFQGMQDAEKTARYLRHSRAELNRLQDLIDKIMQVSREEQEHESLHITDADIGTLIDDTVNRFTHLPQVSIRQQSDIKHPHIRTDATAFAIILTNLIDNAVKYNNKPSREVLVTAKEYPDHFTFSVKDNGNGIEKQHFPFLYDKFYRVVQGDRHDIKGYGLGLSHVKALLGQMNGSISISSTPGNGTTFTFQLPKYEKNQAAAGRR